MAKKWPNFGLICVSKLINFDQIWLKLILKLTGRRSRPVSNQRVSGIFNPRKIWPKIGSKIGSFSAGNFQKFSIFEKFPMRSLLDSPDLEPQESVRRDDPPPVRRFPGMEARRVIRIGGPGLGQPPPCNAILGIGVRPEKISFTYLSTRIWKHFTNSPLSGIRRSEQVLRFHLKLPRTALWRQNLP